MWCSLGEHDAPVDQFYRRHDSRGGHQAGCKPCRKIYRDQHYTDNRAYYIAKALRHRDEVRLRIRALKEGRPCSICGGQFHFAALEWHHRDRSEKAFAIGDACRTHGWDRIVAEIAKCDLVCANCHAELEYETNQCPARDSNAQPPVP